MKTLTRELIAPENKTLAALSRYAGRTTDEMLEAIYEMLSTIDLNTRKTITATIDGIEISLVPDYGEYPFKLYFKLPENFASEPARTIRVNGLAVPENLQNSFIAENSWNILCKIYCEAGVLGKIEMVKRLDAAYQDAIKSGDLRQHRDCINFVTDIVTDTGAQLVAGIKKKGNFWNFCFFGETQKVRKKEIHDLDLYAEMNGKRYVFDILNVASSEDWSRGGDANATLETFIGFQFERAVLEGKLVESYDGHYSCFDTGLHNDNYEPVYLVFEKSFCENGQDWRYADAVAVGNGYYGDVLVRKFRELPTAPDFGKSAQSDLDTSKPVYFDKKHVCLDRINRLPKDYLKNLFAMDAELLNLLDNTGDADESYEAMRSRIKANPMFENLLYYSMQMEIEKSIRATRYNPNRIYPCYHETQKQLDHLVPMQIAGETIGLIVEECDNALMVQTILTKEQSFRSLRLVSEVEENPFFVA